MQPAAEALEASATEAQGLLPRRLDFVGGGSDGGGDRNRGGGGSHSRSEQGDKFWADDHSSSSGGSRCSHSENAPSECWDGSDQGTTSDGASPVAVSPHAYLQIEEAAGAQANEKMPDNNGAQKVMPASVTWQSFGRRLSRVWKKSLRAFAGSEAFCRRTCRHDTCSEQCTQPRRTAKNLSYCEKRFAHT